MTCRPSKLPLVCAQASFLSRRVPRSDVQLIPDSMSALPEVGRQDLDVNMMPASARPFQHLPGRTFCRHLTGPGRLPGTCRTADNRLPAGRSAPLALSDRDGPVPQMHGSEYRLVQHLKSFNCWSGPVTQ